MRRLLVAWDLGGGLGHITALAGVLERLPADIEVHAAVRDRKAARDWFPARTRVERAPGLKPGKPSGPQLTYADLLWSLGWSRPDELRAVVGAWRSIVERVDPQAILFDTAPALLLATQDMDVARIGFCNPWGCPGDTVPLPPMRPWMRIPEPPRLQGDRRLLAAIEAATGQALPSVSSLYQVPHLLYGIAETDPWWNTRGPGRRYVGPVVHTGKGRAEAFPPGRGRRIFTYVRRNYPHRALVLDALARLGRPVLAYVPGHREAQRGAMRITGQPVRFDTLVEDADLVVTHSVLGTGFSFLRSGVPVLLLPMQGEQMAMSWRCGALPGIRSLPPDRVPRDFEPVLHQMLVPELRLQTRATRLALAAPEDPFGTVAAAVLEAA